MKRYFNFVLVLCLICCLVSVFVACKDNPSDEIQQQSDPATDGATAPSEDKSDNEPGEETPSGDKEDDGQKINPKVQISLADGRKIRLELYPDAAPITVANFLKLVDSGFYTNTIYHRVIDNFMIQGGWFEYSEGPHLSLKPTVDTIKGEFAENGFENTLKHDAGVISMARSSENDSASGQFFICTHDGSEAPNVAYLDGKYAAFGRTIDDESLAVVKSIGSMNTGNVNLGTEESPFVLKDFPINEERTQIAFVVISSITRMEA